MAQLMKNRLGLHELLCDALGTQNVYFQPPEGQKMKYPAIVYSRDDIESDHANNTPYRRSPSYQVTVIDSDPDSEIVDRVSNLPMCSFERHFTSDNLNHDVFIIYY